jgi:hypothetical protein
MPSLLSTAAAPHQVLDLFMPLAFFYVRQNESMPHPDLISGVKMPQPEQHLLVHESDMTPRLRNFHATGIGLRVVDREASENFVMRLVVLFRQDTGHPVEVGAIGIQLEGFPAETRAEILAGITPLGGILEAHAIKHESAPKAYFSIAADTFLAELLGVPVGATVYGRCNALSHSEGMVFADIVEILPCAHGQA